MAWEARSGLKLPGLIANVPPVKPGLNGLGSPFGIETTMDVSDAILLAAAKWPGKPVRD